MATSLVGRKGESALQVPSSSTFSFKAPFPASSSTSNSAAALKQRRVSLALPSTPKVAWDFRDDTGVDSHVPETETMPEKRSKLRKTTTNGAEKSNDMPQEKKQRKKWTEEETQMLVTGCNIHGVGNWKTILSDPNLKFDNRSPVDLKDRFRTYFPDAYKEHYPNARTHLSSKVRSTLPDGTSLFEKTRSKKRRPFTEEEDRALKAGYEKHGTVWAAIVKDPIFREQGRRSTDLRDRFRNAFPELYKAAGYKPRNSAKKKLLAETGGGGSFSGLGGGAGRGPIRAADDQLPLSSSTGPVRSRRRAHTNQGLLRGGTKSVPQSAAASEDEDSSCAEDDGPVFKTPHTPVLVDNISTSQSNKLLPFDDDDMDMVTFDHVEPLGDYLSTHGTGQFSQVQDTEKHSQTWSSGVNTPTHSVNAWSTAAGSPTSSHLSADFLGNTHSPSFHHQFSNMGMIGKSAWGTQDWFSANPRMDPGSSGIQNNSNNSIDEALSPASPFSFHNLNHGVLDRYDLHPPMYSNDFASEVGVGDTHSTFSDEIFPMSGGAGFRGFTHHSNFAGDLIFGARTHQPVQGFGGFADFNNTGGLGLSGMSQSQGIHPMQLTMSGIDEMALAGITLDDDSSSSVHGTAGDSSLLEDAANIADLMISDEPHPGHQQAREENLNNRSHGHGHGHSQSQDVNTSGSSLGGLGSSVERFNLDDLVDLSGHDAMDMQHSTPPATPLMSERAGRRANTFHGLSGAMSGHGRSISVPPTDARIPANTSAPAGLDLAGVNNPGTYANASSRPPTQRHPNSQPTLSSTIRTSGFYGQERPRHTSDAATTPSATTAPLAKDDSYLPSSSMSMDHNHHSLYPNQLLDPHSNELSWRAAFGHSSSDGNLNLPFLDLHYYGLHAAASGMNGHGGGAGGPNGFGMEDYDAVAAQALRQGQALDLAQPLASGSSINLASLAASSTSHAFMGPPLTHKGLTLGNPSFKSTFGGQLSPLPPQGTPTTPVGPRPGQESQQMSLGEGVDKMNAIFGNIGTGTGTIRARRSQGGGGHHRSQTQSGINPQELMLGAGGDTKRKRLSWDGAAQ